MTHDTTAGLPAPATAQTTAPAGNDKIAVQSAFIHRLQRRHFLYFDVLPPIACAALLVPAFMGVLPTGGFEVALLVGLWLLTGLGITVGYHRLFTHRSFKASPALKNFLAITAAMAGQGSVTSWVALHRLHHERSDQEGDPHSPNLHGKGAWNRTKGLLHSHFTWMAKHAYPNVVRYAPDMLRDKDLARISRHYHWWIVLGLVLPAALGGLYHQSIEGAVAGLLWGGLLRMVVLEHIIWSINSFLHTWGSRPYQTRENSHNSALLSVVTLGESWHNNHHRFPNSPSFGLTWYRPDPGYWFIWVMARLGLATDLRMPDPEAIRSRRLPDDATQAS